MSAESAELLGITLSDEQKKQVEEIVADFMASQQRLEQKYQITQLQLTQMRNVLQRMGNVVSLATSSPALAPTALGDLADGIVELDELLNGLIDPGTPEEARAQLKQRVEAELGSVEKRVEWSEEAKRVTELPSE